MDRFSINWRRVGLIAGTAFLVLLVIEFNNRLNELNHLDDEAQIYRTSATQAQQTHIALETQVAYAGSDAAAEEYARTEAHKILDGEIPVVPVPDAGNTVIATPTPMPTPTQMPNWQVWWNLFFSK